MKFSLNRCKTKPFRSKNDTYSVRDALPRELFEGGSYFFQCREGELFKELRYLQRVLGISFWSQDLLYNRRYFISNFKINSPA